MKRLVVSIILLVILQSLSSCSGNATNQQRPSPLYSTGSMFHTIAQNEYYVDKSGLLKILFNEGNPSMLGSALFTAPKGFGKTTNLKMIAAFCEIQVDSETGSPIIAENLDNVTNTPNYKLFTGKHKFGEFAISKDEEFMRQHFGKYPVIYLDFAGVAAANNVENVTELCSMVLHRAYVSHKYLTQSPRLSDNEKAVVKHWSDEQEYLRTDMPYYRIEDGLDDLISYLCQHYNRQVVVLIDEFDVPIRKVLTLNLNDEKAIEDTLKPFVGMLCCLKPQADKLILSLITGVTDFRTMRLIGGVPIRIYLFGRNDRFWPYFGFTSHEVEHLLGISPFKSNASVKVAVDECYNGYLADGNRIYTPKSILKFLSEGKIGQYWSEESAIILDFWKALRVHEIRKLVLDLVDNKSIVIRNIAPFQESQLLYLKEIIEAERISVNTYKPSVFFNFILHLGYLRTLSTNWTAITVDIPNNEVRADILQYLATYRHHTMQDEEVKLQRQFLEHLTELKVDKCAVQLQNMTNVLNNLCAIVIPRPFPSLFKQDDVKEVLRDTFSLGGINFFREIRPQNENDEPDYEKLDFLLTNLTTTYVFIKTTDAQTPKEALNRITDLYLPLKNSAEYQMTQQYYLLLGINLSSTGIISISASFHYSNGTSIFNETLTATAK